MGVSARLASAEIYDMSTTTWISVPDMAVPREQHTATLMSDGRALIAGGWNGERSLAEVEIFDSDINSWLRIDPLGHPRWGHTATTLLDGRVLIIGGVGADDLPTDTVEKFDPG